MPDLQSIEGFFKGHNAKNLKLQIWNLKVT